MLSEKLLIPNGYTLFITFLKWQKCIDGKQIVDFQELRRKLGGRKVGVAIKDNMSEPCDGNNLYLDCLNINILVVILH